MKSIERSKTEIYDIAESTLAEQDRVSEELVQVKNEVSDIIKKVDLLSREEKKARLRLVEVSKDFRQYTEKDIKEAYETAYLFQAELIRLKEREKLLRYRRDHLEVSLRRLKNTVQRAEKLVSRMGVVFDFLSGGLRDLNTKINELQQAQDMALSIIRAQEEERKRIAREIHDGPAQSMANIVMRAEYCIKLLDMSPKQVQSELITLQNLVRLTLTDVRKIIFDLRPMVLDDLGLAPAIKRYLSNYKEQYGLQVEFICFGQQRRLESSVEIALFRMVQELVSNVQKHAQAQNAVVKIELLNKKINVHVKDNGVGFDLEKVMSDNDREGYGLIGLRERVQLLSGEIKIVTAPGKGTSINLSIPVED